MENKLTILHPNFVCLIQNWPNVTLKTVKDSRGIFILPQQVCGIDFFSDLVVFLPLLTIFILHNSNTKHITFVTQARQGVTLIPFARALAEFYSICKAIGQDRY